MTTPAQELRADPAKVREAHRRAQAELDVAEQVRDALLELADGKLREIRMLEQRAQAIRQLLESLPQESTEGER